MAERHSHCSYCGHAYPGQLAWPRTCQHCQQTSFINPTPVAVVVVPVGDGVLAIQRGIAPGLGEWALPGGFIDFGETWQAACVRELYEETGITIDVSCISLLAVENAPGVLLLFGLASPLQEDALPAFVPTPETTDRAVLRAPQTLAFPLHTKILTAYLTGHPGRG